MEEIRGPAGRTMWDKLGNVNETVLANYLKNEYPQTIAVVLSKLKPEHAARVLAILPEDMALDVVGRMLKSLPPYFSPSASIRTAARSGPVSLRLRSVSCGRLASSAIRPPMSDRTDPDRSFFPSEYADGIRRLPHATRSG
jgi:hypothetical protein